MQSHTHILTLLFSSEADFQEDSPAMAYFTPIGDEVQAFPNVKTQLQRSSSIIKTAISQKGSHPAIVVKVRVISDSLV
jgi:hypothetical protein